MTTLETRLPRVKSEQLRFPHVIRIVALSVVAVLKGIVGELILCGDCLHGGQDLWVGQLHAYLRVGGEDDTGTNLAEALCLLVDLDGNATLQQAQSSHAANDASTDDGNFQSVARGFWPGGAVAGLCDAVHTVTGVHSQRVGSVTWEYFNNSGRISVAEVSMRYVFSVHDLTQRRRLGADSTGHLDVCGTCIYMSKRLNPTQTFINRIFY